MILPSTDHPFARTNIQTIRQRAGLLGELVPAITSVAEICCGDCQGQYDLYRSELRIQRFCGLDLSPEVVTLNRARNIPCVYGNALDPSVMKAFLDFDALFFGPPLSIDCDRHHLVAFRDVTPDYFSFSNLFLGELKYNGLFILIGPRPTTPGDASWLDHHIRTVRPDYRLRLMHYSYASVTGQGEETEMRLKYVELWFQVGNGPEWEMRESRG